MKIFIALMVALAAFGSIDCDCFKNVKKYYQCKYFTPLMIQDPNDKTYYQDPSVTYDLVADDFVKTRNISNYTIDDAMDFYKKIFTEMNGKLTPAKCFNTNFRDSDGSYSRLFTSKGYFDGAKDIIVNFKDSIKAHLKNRSDSDISDLWTDWNSDNTPTLVDFCIKYEITSQSNNFYNSPALSCYMDTASYYELYWSCVYDLVVNQKSSKVNLSPNSLKLAQCSILQAKNCPDAIKKYYGLTDWAEYFPKVKVPTGITKMGDFFLKVASDGQALNIKWNMTYLYSDFDSKEIRKVDGKMLEFQFTSCNFYETILSTNALLLEGYWQKVDSNCYLSKANLTLYNSANSQIAFKKYDVVNPDFKNKAYTKVNKKNVLYEVSSSSSDYNYIELYVLNSNTYIRLYYFYVDVYIPKEQLNNSTAGIFVDGFDHATVGRRKRDASSSNDCVKTCQQRYRPFRPTVPDETSNYNKYIQCMKNCQ